MNIFKCFVTDQGAKIDAFYTAQNYADAYHSSIIQAYSSYAENNGFYIAGVIGGQTSWDTAAVNLKLKPAGTNFFTGSVYLYAGDQIQVLCYFLRTITGLISNSFVKSS